MLSRGHKNSHNDLSAKFVREIFQYDAQTGILTWKISLSHRAPIGKPAGAIDDQGRIKIGINKKDYFAHRIIWLYVTGKWPRYEVDHRNENKADNRWKNLRAATSSQNHRNRGAQKNNTSGFKGVTYDTKRKCFIAGVKLMGKRYNCRGAFSSAAEAHKAYKSLAKKLHGSFAKFS